MESDADKIAELNAIIEAVRTRVRARYPRPEDGAPAANGDSGPRIQTGIADLMPVVHARDAAQAKIASIGSVNPRPGGLVNKSIQAVKKAIARALGWFVRDQIAFNRESIAALEAVLEALNDHNRSLIDLARQANDQLQGLREEIAARGREFDGKIAVYESIPGEVGDIRKYWIAFRGEWEHKLAANEIQFLRSAADLQGAFQHRVTQMESNFREIVKSQHGDYLGALDRANLDIQKRLWADMEKIKIDYERLIHTELRLMRQRGPVASAIGPPLPVAAGSQAVPGFDYGRFAERFRGPEEYVKRNDDFYKPVFAGCGNVLDAGCGRGEFLEAMRDAGIGARGIDLSAESVERCRQKGLFAEAADLFEYLAAQADAEFDGIMSSQVVEHIAPERLPEMIRLCAAKLRRGGVLAIETPNPECLAIFATHFYLDPTHTRPVPASLLSFYMEEAGLGGVEIHPLSPVAESIPEVAELPAGFGTRFFGGLDYAIVARKL